MNNTSIVPAQRSASAIVPKPTKNDLIEALISETIAKRERENEIRGAKRDALQVKFNKATEKWKKTKISIEQLDELLKGESS